ncbi:MAG: hypothetical protein PSN37_02610 [Alphaproteobacteria bacterium]|nr:hypothetical protein [Alphaproteobacteria bacterium]
MRFEKFVSVNRLKSEGVPSRISEFPCLLFSQSGLCVCTDRATASDVRDGWCSDYFECAIFSSPERGGMFLYLAYIFLCFLAGASGREYKGPSVEIFDSYGGLILGV